MGDDVGGCASAAVLFLPEALVAGVWDVGGGAPGNERDAGDAGDSAGVLAVQAVVWAAEGRSTDAVLESISAADSL